MLKAKAECGEPCGFQGLHPQPAVHLLQREVLGGWWQVRLLTTSSLLVGCWLLAGSWLLVAGGWF